MIDLKASVPDVDKTIVDGKGTDKDNGSVNKGDAAGIGDTVQFKLEGKLPKNFGDFDKYEYIFHDTLSKGLNFSDEGVLQVTVTIVKSDGTSVNYTIREENSTLNDADDGTGYTMSKEVVEAGAGVDPEDVGKTKLTVKFSDLKKLQGNDGTSVNWDEARTYNDDVTITVVYSVTIDSDVVIGSNSNPNDVNLEYSNDPNHEGTGQTEDKEVYVYAFGLDLTKVGTDDKHDNEGLSGAGFVLSKKEGATTYYAKFEDVKDSSDKVTGRRLVEWVTENESGNSISELIETYKTAKESYENAANEDRADGGTAKTALDAAEAALESYLLKSGDDGKIPSVTGLDEGDYILDEVITPDGYNTMDSFKFNIKATFNSTTGKLESVTYTNTTDPDKSESTVYKESADAGAYDDLRESDTATEASKRAGIFSSGLLPETLVNQKAPFLPFTGGMGTAVFYILGGLLIAGAVLYLVISARKRNR